MMCNQPKRCQECLLLFIVNRIACGLVANELFSKELTTFILFSLLHIFYLIMMNDIDIKSYQWNFYNGFVFF